MLSRKNLFIGLSIVAVFVLGVAIVSAQGNGNRNGNGNNGANGIALQDCSANTGSNGVALQNCSDNQNNMRQGGQNGNQNTRQPGYGLPSGEVLDVDLPDDVIEGLTVTLLDEYAAYDVYNDMIEQLGEVIPFVNLRNAEANHALALERVFLRYGLELPVAGEVDVPEFATVTGACTRAYDIEVANVDLYDTYLPLMSDYPDMTRVMTNLRDASFNNHMPILASCSGQ